MAKVSEQLRQLEELFRQHERDRVALSPSVLGVFAGTLKGIGDDAAKLEKMLERRLKSQQPSAQIINMPGRPRLVNPTGGAA